MTQRIQPILLVILCSCMMAFQAHAQLRIQIQVAKPYPNKINDFQSNPNQVVILISNLTRANRNVQLLASVTGDNGITVRTSTNYRSSRALIVPAGTVTRVTADEVGELFDPGHLVFSGITRQEAVRLNGLPEGAYQICVQAIDFATRQPLSDEEPLGCSNLFMITSLEPPVILKPFADDSLKAYTPQNIVFSWSLPPGAPPTTQYSVRIVEIPDAQRNPFDVMRASRQPYFEQTVSGAPTMLYGPAEPPLIPARRYAMMVTAIDPFNNVVFRNGGRSEVIAFTYGKPSKSPVSSFVNKTATTAFPFNIARSLITGKINWYFKSSEEGNSMLNNAATLGSFAQVTLVNTMLDPTAGTGYSQQLTQVMTAKPAGNTTNIVVAQVKTSIPLTPSQPIVQSPRSTIGNTQAAAIGVNTTGTVGIIAAPGLVAASGILDRVAALTDLGTTPHPLKQVDLKIYAVRNNGGESLIASTTTNEEGYFEAPFVNTAFYNSALGDKIKVYISHPDFVLQFNEFKLPKPDSAGRYDVGTLSAAARTFRLKPTIVDEEQKEITDAVVEVYRREIFYAREPNHTWEGSARIATSTIINGQSYRKVASIRSGQTGNRLFYSDDWMDHYLVKVVHQRLVPKTETLKIVADGSARETIATIPITYNTITRMPSLKGRVSKRLQPILDVRGAIVTLHFNDDAEFGKTSNTNVEAIGSMYLNGTLQATVNQPVSPAAAAQKPAGEVVTATKPATLAGNANILAPIAYPANSTAASFVGTLATSVTAAAILGNTRSTTTDSAGNFLFTNLPISPTPTRITIRIPGSEKVYEQTADISVKGVDIDLGRILLDMVVITVGGVVKNEAGEPISQPVLSWASGGSKFDGDNFGRFIATNTAGTDTLIITKLGYETKKVPVTLKEPSASGKKDSNPGGGLTVGAWATSVQNLPSFTNTRNTPVSPSTPVQQVPAFSSTALGYTAIQTGGILNSSVMQPQSTNNKPSTSGNVISTIGLKTSVELAYAPAYSALFPADAQPAAAVDLGTIVLRKKIGRLLVKVIRDSDKSPLSNAKITVNDTPLTGETNTQGAWYSEVPGGEIVVAIAAPAGSALVSVQKQIATSDTDTTVLDISLKSGVRVTGTVKAGSQLVQDATIRVDGFDYLHAQTNPSGKYQLIVPTGSYTLKVAKSGYVGVEQQRNFSGTEAVVDFTLTQPGFDITAILGFPVEIEQMQGSGNTRVLSGAFVNLPSNNAFQIKPGTRIPFDNLNVAITAGKPVPQGGQVSLSVTTLDAKVFNYLPVKIKNGDQALVIRQVSGTQSGQLTGIPEIDYNKFMPIPLGFVPVANARHQLAPSEIPIIQSGEGYANPEGFTLSMGSNATVQIYSFELKPASAQVKADGLHLTGELNLAGVPLINSAKLEVRELAIGTDAGIKKIDLNVGSGIGFSLAGWQAQLTGVAMNENGLKVSGNIRVKVPASAESAIAFDQLAISKTALYGGNFSLPAEGLDIFGIVKMKPGNKPLSFGRIGNTSVHYIGGSGQFNLPKFIDKTLTVEFFQIQTDGNFEATVPANFNIKLLSIADIAIRSIGFRTAGGVGIDVKGDFNLNGIPFFQASAGGIHYERGGSISVEELGIGFDLVGIARLSARAKFIDQPDRKGFEGNGKIQISATPLNLELGFKYYKLPGGIEVGGMLRAGVVIPIGFVTLTEVEGAFSLNTQDKKWMGRIGGSLSIGALNAAIAIKPLAITVENGPVFKIDGGLAVIGQSIAQAHGILDFPRSYFGFTFEQNLDFLPELVTVNGGGAFIISTAKDNTYWMMGVRYQASMLGGLVRANANITAGWGLNVDAHPEHSDYTAFIDRSYLNNGRLEGIHVATFAGINFDTGERGFKGIATGRAWYNNHGAVNMDLGFGRGRYGFRVAAGWEAGAYLKLMDMNVAGIEAGIEGEVKGFYDYGASYLSFEGSLRAKLIAWIGNCDSACANKICWGACFNACIFGCEVCPIPVGGKLCLRPGVNARYNSNDGFGLSIDF